MNIKKLNAAAQIIKTETIVFLANKHCVTIDTIVAVLHTGDPRICAQFDELVKVAITEALRLSSEGKINLGEQHAN